MLPTWPWELASWNLGAVSWDPFPVSSRPAGRSPKRTFWCSEISPSMDLWLVGLLPESRSSWEPKSLISNLRGKVANLNWALSRPKEQSPSTPLFSLPIRPSLPKFTCRFVVNLPRVQTTSWSPRMAMIWGPSRKYSRNWASPYLEFTDFAATLFVILTFLQCLKMILSCHKRSALPIACWWTLPPSWGIMSTWPLQNKRPRQSSGSSQCHSSFSFFFVNYIPYRAPISSLQI